MLRACRWNESFQPTVQLSQAIEAATGRLCSNPWNGGRPYTLGNDPAGAEQRFTVYALDRRGRGGSEDAQPYTIEREFDDVAATVNAIGEPVNVLGHSYGALCALEAALRTDHIRKLVLYEPPIPSPQGRSSPRPRSLPPSRRASMQVTGTERSRCSSVTSSEYRRTRSPDFAPPRCGKRGWRRRTR